MLCEITLEPGYLKADVFNRRTVEDTRTVLVAIASEARKHRRSQILISVHASWPIFKVAQSGLLEFFKEIDAISQCRIALTGDSGDLRLSLDYVESLAQGLGVNVRSFSSEQAALDWFRDRRWLLDRRQQYQAWGGKERRQRRPRRAARHIRPASPGGIRA
jgi:hypothetical protein